MIERVRQKVRESESQREILFLLYVHRTAYIQVSRESKRERMLQSREGYVGMSSASKREGGRVRD